MRFTKFYLLIVLSIIAFSFAAKTTGADGVETKIRPNGGGETNSSGPKHTKDPKPVETTTDAVETNDIASTSVPASTTTPAPIPTSEATQPVGESQANAANKLVFGAGVAAAIYWLIM
ncbi:hypothetical protein HK099_001375 [Clydaea vesicula]|uniref:Uncharacterized protein n=1 Tax=Clydaea vesicula TaxID=447962 RepID=A0AAD5TVP9_9FUNG|nr:hypothetical protein HK099_001375 [Clydaea vesicula]KAJ3379095.1 hypothetical protein HDU92_006915 [Lobulomyces angularis]